MTVKLAAIIGIPKGTLKAGGDADVTIFDPKASYQVDKARFRSKSQNTPFHGWEVQGRVALHDCGRKVDLQIGKPDRKRAALEGDGVIGWEGALYLEKGHLFEGRGFGSDAWRGGEAVFNTGMTGYQEIFTDPSYCDQIVVMSYPHIGNTGTNQQDLESKSVDLSGVVVREYCEEPSFWRSALSLDDYLTQAKVPGLSEVDTREIDPMPSRRGRAKSA